MYVVRLLFMLEIRVIGVVWVDFNYLHFPFNLFFYYFIPLT